MKGTAGTLPDLLPRRPRNSFAFMEHPMPIRLSWGTDWPTSASSGGFQPPERGYAGVPLLHQPPSPIRPYHWHRKEHGVDAIEHTSVAGENRAGIFYSGAAFN